jgi:hypothetical protein
MPLLGERQQKFKLVDQTAGPFEEPVNPVMSITAPAVPLRQKKPPARVFLTPIIFSYRLISHAY